MNIPIVNLKATGENINRMRLEAGIAIKDIQEVCGFSSPNAVYKWIHGQNLPTIDNIIILASLLNVSINDILVIE